MLSVYSKWLNRRQIRALLLNRNDGQCKCFFCPEAQRFPTWRCDTPHPSVCETTSKRPRDGWSYGGKKQKKQNPICYGEGHFNDFSSPHCKFMERFVFSGLETSWEDNVRPRFNCSQPTNTHTTCRFRKKNQHISTFLPSFAAEQFCWLWSKSAVETCWWPLCCKRGVLLWLFEKKNDTQHF